MPRGVPLGPGLGRGGGVTLGVAVGVGVGPDVNSMVSTGGLVLSRVSNRFAVAFSDSFPNTSQPKLLPDCPATTAHPRPSVPNSMRSLRYADGLARAHRVRKISALRCPKNSVVETVPPCGIVGGGGRSITLLSGCVGCSFPPVGEQLVQFDGSSSILKGSGHMHAQAHACDG